MKRHRIVLVGGGSNAWTPGIVKDMLLTEGIANSDFVLFDINRKASDLNAAFMAHDLAIPEKYGIYHTVGDTAGPGDWARFIRNFGVFASLADDLKRLAPNAVVLNYTNPMTALTAVLARRFPGPVVGLCHGLFENLEFLKNLGGLEREEDLSIRYAWVNHFFWITEAHQGEGPAGRPAPEGSDHEHHPAPQGEPSRPDGGSLCGTSWRRNGSG